MEMLGPHSPSDDPMRNRQNLTHYHAPTLSYVYVWSEIDLLRNPKTMSGGLGGGSNRWSKWVDIPSNNGNCFY